MPCYLEFKNNYVYVGAHGGQKRVLGASRAGVTGGCELGCLGFLKGQRVFVTAEPALEPDQELLMLMHLPLRC